MLSTMVSLFPYSESFQEMYESQNKDFKPKEGDMPDTMERFDLEGQKFQKKKFSDTDPLQVMAAFICLLGITVYFSWKDRTVVEEKYEKVLELETENVNVSKTTVTVEDVKSKEDFIQATYTEEKKVDQHIKDFEPLMSKEEKLVKILTPRKDLLIIDKPKNLRKGLKQSQAQSENIVVQETDAKPTLSTVFEKSS